MTIKVPPPSAGEADTLVFVLERARAQFGWKSGGLDSAALSKPYPPSTMTLGGLIKHLALVEDEYTAKWLTGEPVGAPWDAIDFEADPQWEWRTAAEDSPARLYALWEDAVQRARVALAPILAERGPDGPTRLVLPSGESPNLRRYLVNLHEEYARHVGHADLFREAIDGLTGEDPPDEPADRAG
jgi:hypothetical protein